MLCTPTNHDGRPMCAEVAGQCPSVFLQLTARAHVDDAARHSQQRVQAEAHFRRAYPLPRPHEARWLVPDVHQALLNLAMRRHRPLSVPLVSATHTTHILL
jgi:hypothetical protein